MKTQANDSPERPFGKRLRLERERRRITLDSIAANTKIGVALLKGLERDDVSRWPSGIFRRSFIREYATAIGLDPDDTTREFLERFPDPDETTRPAPVKASEYPLLRLTLADTESWLVGGRVLAESWRRWAAVGWDLAACLAVSSVLFLALGQWWKPLAIILIGYYTSSILLLGNTPGVFFFARIPTREDVRRILQSAPPLRAALSRLRRNRWFSRLDPPAPLAGAPDPPPQMQRLVSRSPRPFVKSVAPPLAVSDVIPAAFPNGHRDAHHAGN